jgi:peptide-methionine (R)-S-oxide reductase
MSAVVSRAALKRFARVSRMALRRAGLVSRMTLRSDCLAPRSTVMGYVCVMLLAFSMSACGQEAGAGGEGGVPRAADTTALVVGTSCEVPEGADPSTMTKGTAMSGTMNISDEEWRERLSPEKYRILRQKGTERAFTGAYYDKKDAGTYVCAGCGAELFSSETKYDSGSGWPSYWEPLGTDRVAEHRDVSYGMIRTEVTCARCGGHLGHVFDDGPRPTGLRYCINSASLEFKPKTADEKAP